MTVERSGRTGRMLDDALRLNAEGKAVYVLALNDDDAKAMQNALIHKDIGADLNSIKVEPIADWPRFDFTRMTNPGAHSNCVFLVDHSVIEHRYEKMLEELHRYDPPAPKNRPVDSLIAHFVIDYYLNNSAAWRETIGDRVKFDAFVDAATLHLATKNGKSVPREDVKRVLWGLWK